MTSKEFNAEYKLIEDLLFGFAMKLTKNKENAEDLIQETFFRGFKNKDKFSKDTNFRAWMVTIMRNNFINDYRKQKKRNVVLTPIDDFSYFIENKASGISGESIIMMKELNALVEELSDDLKEAFSMFIKGYRYAEIAKKINVPIGTIKSRIFFARKHLRASIKAYYGMNSFTRA